jgi:hypothetical protein
MLECMALWGVRCSFKGFAYNVKLKDEFGIFNWLRGSVKESNEQSYDLHVASKIIGPSLYHRTEHGVESPGYLSRLSIRGKYLSRLLGCIEKKAEIDVRHENGGEERDQSVTADELNRFDVATLSLPERLSKVEFTSGGM